MAPIKNQKSGGIASDSSNAKMKQGNLFSFFAKRTTTAADKNTATSEKQAAPTKALSPSVQKTSKIEDVQKSGKQTNSNSTMVLPKIGSRIEAYWPDDDEWYSATISKQRGKQHFLEYDDGQTEWIDLSTERFRMITANPTTKIDTKPDTTTNGDSNKRRRIQIQDDDEDDEEMEFVDSQSEASDYIDDTGSKSDQEEDDFIVTDDDADEEPKDAAKKASKRVKLSLTNKSKSFSRENYSNKSTSALSQFKAGLVRVTEHAAQESTTNLSLPFKSNSPKQITPSYSMKTPIPSGSPPTVQICKTHHSASSPIVADSNKFNSALQRQNSVSFVPKTVAPPMFVRGEMNLGGSHVHNHLKFLQNPKDLLGRSPDNPEYDRRTLKVDENEWTRVTGKPMTDAVKQWWDLKSQYFDTVLLFKAGKFYEMYHMDADVGVQHCAFNYMNGHFAKSGFPEISYGVFADILVRAGYKVARVEQTETPEQLDVRKKRYKGKGMPKVVNREICSVLTIGTRTFCFLDQSDGKGTGDATKFDRAANPDDAGCLLAIREVLLPESVDDSSKESCDDGTEEVLPVCEYGVVLIDTVRGSITIGQFADDIRRSRMLTLLSTFTPSEILIEGGETGASDTLRSLLRSMQTTSQANFHIETINTAESFPKSTALEANVRKGLERGSGSSVHYVQPWNVEETLSELHRRKYFPQSSKQGNATNISRWPQVLRAVVDGGANLAISSLGACLYYLQRNVIDREILSMGIVKAYIPPESCNATDHYQLENIVQLAQQTNSDQAGIITPSVMSQATANMSSAFVRDDGESPGSKENEITFMSLDGTTLHNLEILTNAVDHKVAGSLWSKLNFTKTPHGSRLLRAWLLRPLFKKADIDRRLDAVTELVSGGAAVALQEARSVLSKCGDIERLLSRVHTMGIGAGANDDEMDHIHPNERAVMYEAVTYTKRKVGDFSKLLNSLKRASQIPEIFQGIEIHSGLLKKVVLLFDHGGSFPDMVEDLDWFFANFDCDLAVKGQFEPSRGIDELFDVATDEIERIKEALMAYKEEMCTTCLQPRAQAKAEWKYANTNPDSKDKYMIELPASIKVPEAFLWMGKRGSGKKQVNKYRSRVIDDLVQQLEKAYEVRNERQAKGMQLIFAKFDSKRDIWAAAAQATALLDALGSLAQTASKPGFVRPTILDCPPDTSPTIRIVQGRHPCVENSMGSEFIPNDLFLGSSDDKVALPRVLLLSGPNMGGKSTLLRQTCLITILSQLGCYVPAAECEITPIDRIFTRLGASDRILLGQSTFFVELSETAAALRGATRRSLVIMDELGRGTSTFDGTAIASAAVQHLVERSKCLTLFATHYHTLLDQWKHDVRVRLGHMECYVDNPTIADTQPTTNTEDDTNTNSNSTFDETNVTFLYTLGDGICPKSFGINVARLAGLPVEVLVNAKRISMEFEEEINAVDNHNRISSSGSSNNKLMISNALEMKKKLSIMIENQNWDEVKKLWEEMQSEN